jgi:hypothetical protein
VQVTNRKNSGPAMESPSCVGGIVDVKPHEGCDLCEAMFLLLFATHFVHYTSVFLQCNFDVRFWGNATILVTFSEW